MHVLVNGERYQVPEGASVADLVGRLGLEGQRVAMEVNEELVPRSEFAAHRLEPGDRVEVVHAIGGG